MSNITQAVFGANGRRTRTRPRYQYDYGQILDIRLDNLPFAYEVHFANALHGVDAKTAIGGADGVTIPDEYFLSGAPIYAWLYLHTGEDDGETEYVIEIPIERRARPTHEEPTPVQQSEITQALAALAAAVSQTGADAASAAASAADASESASDAEAAQSAAESARDAAQAAARDAAGSATAAEHSEYDASISAAAAATVAQEAAESASEAAQSATAAQTAAADAETAQDASEAAQAATESARDTAVAAIQTAGDAEIADIAAAGTTQVGLVAAEGATQIAAVDEKGDEVLESIPEDYTALTEEVEGLKNAFDAFVCDMDTVIARIEQRGNRLYFDEEEKLLYLMSDDEALGDGVAVAAAGEGGGGGGTSYDYTIVLTNLMESRSISAAGGSTVLLRFEYSSKDAEEYDDGPGVGTITIENVRKGTFSVAQGENSLDVTGYLSSGTNNIKIRVENSEGRYKTLTYTVNIITLSLTTTFPEMSIQDNAATFYYTPTGVGSKTMHFLMDGTQIGTATVNSSGRSQTYTIPVQTHGAHVFECYATMTVDGVAIISNILRHGIIFVDSSSTYPVVLSTFIESSVEQGENLRIPYMVYDPLSETADVVLSVRANSSEYSSKSLTGVDRTEQVWAVQDYPAGTVTFRIATGSVYKDVTLTVTPSTVVIEPITDSLVLDFNPAGRSNDEANPATWSQDTIVASFDGVGFAGADGWMNDADGAPFLRLLPGSSMSIPYYLFQNDARTSGVTVEVEMATHNVRDYDSIVMSCMDSNRGFKIASQYAQIHSEQSELSMQFVEDDKVRVSFAVESRNQNRLIYVYVDGIMCGAIQYPADDNFQQPTAVGITIGAESSGIDIYRIQLYSKGLTRHEVLDNFIATRSTLSARLNANSRNDILNNSEEVVISKLPATLPYMIIKCAELPQYKGDKKTCSIEYVNPSDSARSFTAEGVQIDVQGTSSAGYKKKNFKPKFKNGVTYTASGSASPTYKLRTSSLPASTFCLKADVASSEGTNNVELVRLYHDTCPYKTPAMQTDERVRWGIDGLPVVVFWQNTDTNEIRFWGKYNFNDDKSSADVFGLTAGFESWEFKNNTSARSLFHSADFTGTDWLNDFEARYPDTDPAYSDSTKLAALFAWVVSTDRDAVSSASDKAARLQKFKTEFEEHFVKAPMLFYYIFTEVFLMVDSRAKNMFLTYDPGLERWYPLPYDFDTAIGINNEGQLVFDYDLEDTDLVNDSVVFNGQNSALWENVRDAFADDIKAMYATLRSGSLFNYETVISRFAEHQAVWPENIWNEDSFEKYLEPLLSDRDGSYLAMLQGSKASQREWWLYNGFRYRDSKYQTGLANSNYIYLRGYQVADITVTPYSHVWTRIKYGSYTVTARGKRNVPQTLVNPLDAMSDTEVYIYSADRLASVGDLSPMLPAHADFSMATKLQSLKLGDADANYSNQWLTAVYVGNNELLTVLDVRNCINLGTGDQKSIDLSSCISIEEVYAKGTAITGVTLPVGGKLETLQLPATITNLTIRNQANLETLSVDGYTNLATIRIENTPNVPLATIISAATSLNRVRLIGVEWTEASESDLTATITKLENCIGMDASGGNTEHAVVSGRVNVPTISAELLAEINDNFPELVVVVNDAPQYIGHVVNYDGTLLYREVIAEGGNAYNPVTTGAISAPTRPNEEDTGYQFRDFGTLPTNVHNNFTLVAQYDTTYRVLFMNGSNTYSTKWVLYGANCPNPGTPSKSSTAQYSYTFVGWSRTSGGSVDSTALQNITAPRTLYAVYTSTVRTYTVYFYNGTTLLQTVQNVAYCGSATYTGSTPTDPRGNEFTGWSPAPTNIQANTSCYAQFKAAGTVWSDPTIVVTNAYAVQWDYSIDSPVLARGGLAANFSDPAPATSLAGSGSSPFDSIMPWAGMKRYNIIDGAVSYSQDDAGFSETDYDTVVYIPEFYYCVEKDTDNSRWTWAISQTAQEGYTKHPGSGRYVGRFHTSGDSSVVFTKAGVAPLVNISRTNFRTYSHNKGSKWWMLDLATWSALQMLYLIEFANFHSQDTLGTGYTGVTSAVAEMGATGAAAYHTLKISAGHNQYRWVEDPFSNCRDWVDGAYFSSRFAYIGTNNATFGDSTSNLTSAGIALPTHYYITGFGYSASFPWAFIPDDASSDGAADKYVTDYVYSNSGDRALNVGGGYSSNDYYGFFCFGATSNASGTVANIGSRLLYIP